MTGGFLSVFAVKRAFVATFAVTDDTCGAFVFRATQCTLFQGDVTTETFKDDFSINGTLAEVHIQGAFAIIQNLILDGIPTYGVTVVNRLATLRDVHCFVATVAQFSFRFVVIHPDAVKRGVLVVAVQPAVRGVNDDAAFFFFGQVNVGIVRGDGVAGARSATSGEQADNSSREQNVFHRWIPLES